MCYGLLLYERLTRTPDPCSRCTRCSRFSRFPRGQVKSGQVGSGQVRSSQVVFWGPRCHGAPLSRPMHGSRGGFRWPGMGAAVHVRPPDLAAPSPTEYSRVAVGRRGAPWGAVGRQDFCGIFFLFFFWVFCFGNSSTRVPDFVENGIPLVHSTKQKQNKFQKWKKERARASRPSTVLMRCTSGLGLLSSVRV